MKAALIEAIQQQNPWLNDPTTPIIRDKHYIPRRQTTFLENNEWDSLWTILVGPRQSGKTTLGKHLCQTLLKKNRFEKLLYLNCDHRDIRLWLTSPTFITDAEKIFHLKNYILFIDEVQRVENPGLLLKQISDLNLPIKKIASGSSQLEIRSKVQEHLTGRQLETLILPLSSLEIDYKNNLISLLQFGSYPQVYLAQQKQTILQELFNNYIQKDIIEYLQLGHPDIIPTLLGLLAHSSGQLLNFQQLSADCRLSMPTLKNYMDILEKTYIIKTIKPYVGNKRTELTSNPICYFLDNGFRNQALNNFSPIENRTDNGLLIENWVFQELYKHQLQERKNWQIHYWRTKAGAEVDFVIKVNFNTVIPIEVKYRSFQNTSLTRGYQSFLEAYEPSIGFIITKDYRGSLKYHKTNIEFIPLEKITTLLNEIAKN